MEHIYTWLEGVTGLSPLMISKLLKSFIVIFGFIIVNRITSRIVFKRTEDVYSRYRWRKTQDYITFVIGLFVAVNMIMGSVVEPKFMGRSLGLSTLVVFLSLIFWGWLLGMVGMLLSVPLTMIFKLALENSTEGRWFAILLSSDEEIDALVDKDEKIV